jgi:signal transduction histidine kinase
MRQASPRHWQSNKKMQRETDRVMHNREQTVLLVSDDAALCAAARREFETRIAGLRVSAVSNLGAARRILEDDAPAVILLEEASIATESEGPRGMVPRLDAVVTSLAVYAPVVVIGTAEQRTELSALIAAGAADYVARDGGCLPAAMGMIQRRLRQTQRLADSTIEPFRAEPEDFGEVLRHELNNPLTGILGNAELLLADIHKKNDGQLPHGGQQRVETIAALAVRLRETVRRLSQEWESRRAQIS